MATFFALMTKLSSCDRTIWRAKPKIFTTWTFTGKKFLIPDSDDTWLITLTSSGLEIIQNFSECLISTLDQELEGYKKIEILKKEIPENKHM